MLYSLMPAYPSSLSEDNFSCVADLDNDGKNERVVYRQLYEGEPSMRIGTEITVFRPDGSEAGSFSMGDRMGKVELVSLNKDGRKQIATWSSSGMHYTGIDIFGYRDGKAYRIFENGSACPVEVDLEADRPIIKVGIAKWGTKILTEDGEEINWSYASGGHGDCYWQVYAWDGEKFIYDEKLSTYVEVTEEQQLSRFMDECEKLKNK